MSFIKSITDAGKGGHAKGLLYAGLLGLLLSDIIPTPADALYFKYQKKLKDDLAAGDITPRQYWLRGAAGYYFMNPIWWLIVILIISNVEGDSRLKFKIAVGLIASGLVVAVLFKNIKDEQNGVTEKFFK